MKSAMNGSCWPGRSSVARISWNAVGNKRGGFQPKGATLLLLALLAQLSQSLAGLRGSDDGEFEGLAIVPVDLTSNDTRASRPLDVAREYLSRRTQVIEVRSVHIELTVALHFVGDDAAALLSARDPTNSVVRRFCSAVNGQAGGSQARKSAEEDSLTLFTRLETGCEILSTNQIYTYGDPPGPSYSSLEISFRQEVFLSPIGNGTLDGGDAPLVDRVTRHSSSGFEKGNGGRARFRKRLKMFDSEPVTAFDAVEDIDLINAMSPPLARPTASPSREPTSTSPTRIPTSSPATPTSASPTLVTTTSPTAAPETVAPSRIPTFVPTKTTSSPTTTPVTVRPSLITSLSVTTEPTSSPYWQHSSEGPSDEVLNSDARDEVHGNAAKMSDTGGGGPKVPTAAIAAAAGAALGVLAVGLFTLWRCRTEDDDSIHGGKPKQPPTSSTSPSTRMRRSIDAVAPSGDHPPPAPPSATSSVVRLGARRAPPVPSVVALPEGGEVGSVADSTLGDRTAGRKPQLAVRPPASILKSSMRHGNGNGWCSNSIAASSQISSLESGTIGAGGDRTLGGFSLEAAIKECSARDEEVISSDTFYGNDAHADIEKGKSSSQQHNINVSTVGIAQLSGAIVREEGNEGNICSTAGGDTSSESLAGTTSLMGASYQSAMYSSSKEDEKEISRNRTTLNEPNLGIENSSDGDVTPRASGTRIANLNVDLEDSLLFPLHTEDRVEPSSYLPNNLVEDYSLEQSRMNSPPPPSLQSTSDSQTSWSEVFAAGTAAILSASFEQATSNDAENEDADKPAPDTPTVPSPKIKDTEVFLTELDASQTYSPPDFPDSGPLRDANSSDGRNSSVNCAQEENEGNESCSGLNDEDRGEWHGYLLKPGPVGQSVGHCLSDTGSAVSSIPPPPPNYPSSLESAEGESLLSSAKDSSASKVFGSSIEGDALSSEYDQSVALGWLGKSNGTQAADVAAGPANGGLRDQVENTNKARTESREAGEAGISKVKSAGRSEIDWAYVAKVAATNGLGKDVPGKQVAERPDPTESMTHATGQSPSNVSLAVVVAQQASLSSKVSVDSKSPNCDEKNDNASTSSSSSGGNTNPWLIDAVAGALGPRSVAADLESLSERSNRSNKSQRSSGLGSPVKSVRGSSNHAGSKRCSTATDVSAASVASSRASHQSRRSQNSTASAKSITSDLIRLEAQLKAIGSSQNGSPMKVTRSFGSDIGLSSGNHVTPSPPKTTRYIGRRARITVEAPPGRLGVILANRSDGKGTVVSALRTSSPLAGKLNPGDRLEAVDGEDVSEMKVSEVTAIMARKSDRKRTLSVVTPGKIRLGQPSLSSPRSSKKDSASLPLVRDIVVAGGCG
uniref:PDZ domain-containing protein n=1 Tax=Odontella aurita TaxID=265563 RepID=A0A7S4HSF2_9STRA|mmetsp:Transcript_14450/g.42344  ORF Transcript_14450/g.42344 Transcript_14450/m.42344 type:complete len:1357 (+) Transcript_14450:311-4381(+)